ncbi:hypothetical protein Q5P01_023795 [Channa striata]|uniref:Uncharacterized protein n=1 Tax=Channa striata TaxID=64152 RepID=A0AA88LR33_CHASR|nr:hypothetical protein Q5P01_023795 [Channa striata]
MVAALSGFRSDFFYNLRTRSRLDLPRLEQRVWLLPPPEPPRPPPAALVAQRLDAPLSPRRGEAGTDRNRCTQSISCTRDKIPL